MLNGIKTKLYETIRIRKIRKSIYFDSKYYLRQNADVAAAHLDPASHYYRFGWKEGRNASEVFDNDLYIKLNSGKIPEDICPLYHYITKGCHNPEIIGPYDERFCYEYYNTNERDNIPMSVSEMLNNYFHECVAFKTLHTTRARRRLNIVFNGFDNSCFFGGKATALILALLYVNRYDYDLRIISQNPERKILDQFINLFDLEKPQNVEYFATDFGTLLELSDKDGFLCTMWSNACAVLDTPEITGKVFYIMQEVETFFYDHGDYHLRCFDTLTNSRIIPIVNSKLLYDYLISNGYNNVRENGVYFEPVFSSKLLKPEKDSFKKKDRYKLFFYGRPSHQRNIFYFGIDCLNTAFLTGSLNPEEWTVYVAGDSSVPDFRFDADVEVQRLGVTGWKEYCDFVSTVDLCYSLIYTPHPSYSQLDAAAVGAVCVTNRAFNKQDSSNYSHNIITAELKKQAMVDALGKGAELAKNIELRQKNHADSHICGNWEEALAASVEHMHSFIEDL